MFSPGKIQYMTGGHGLGGTCDHIKRLWIIYIYSHIKGNSALKAGWADNLALCMQGRIIILKITISEEALQLMP